MTPPSSGESKRTFSGKLPFRTSSETHAAIYQAAKQEGMSINAWMDKTLAAAANPALSLEPTPAADEPEISSAITHLMQTNPQAFFQLIDQVQPRLRDPKVNNAVLWLSHVQKLMQDFDRLQASFALPPQSFADYLEQIVIPIAEELAAEPNTQQFALLCAHLQIHFTRQIVDREPDEALLLEFVQRLNRIRSAMNDLENVNLFKALSELANYLLRIQNYA